MKKLLIRITGVIVTLCLPLVVGSVAHAAADTCTWTGLGADNNVSTAANWSDGAGSVVECDNGNIPENGDSLVIPAGTPRQNVNNTTLTAIGTISLPSKTGAIETIIFDGAFTLAGDVFVESNRTINLPDVTLGADVTFHLEYSINGLTVNGVGQVNFVNKTLDLNGHSLNIQTKDYVPLIASDLPLSYKIYVPEFSVSGGGSIVGNSTTDIYLQGLELTLWDPNPTFAGNIVAYDSIVSVDFPANLGTGSLTLNDSQLAVGDTVTPTALKDFTQNITFNGNLYGATNDDHFANGQAGVDNVGVFDIKFSGAAAFTKDLLIKASSTSDARTVTFSGPLTGPGITSLDVYTGNYQLIIASSSNASVLPNGTFVTVGAFTTLTDSLPATNIIVPYGTVTVNGSRGNVILSTGSELKGTGTVGDLLVQTTAKLMPGLSPGCITTSNLTMAGIFEVELGGLTACTQHDRTIANGAVNLTGGTLSIVRYDNMVPRLNDSFIIISNDGTDAVIGTFAGLAQGATTVVDGITYTISYTGGDGNDVVLVATAVASSLGAPNTGFLALKASVIMPALVMVSALAIVGSQKFAFKKNK